MNIEKDYAKAETEKEILTHFLLFNILINLGISVKKYRLIVTTKKIHSCNYIQLK